MVVWQQADVDSLLHTTSRNLPHEKRPQQKDRRDDLKPPDPHVKYQHDLTCSQETCSSDAG